MATNGLFVVIEGIDGSGKSTQVELVSNKLQEMGFKAIQTSEPTTTKLGLLLREYLSNPQSVPQSDALLFAADRVEHYYQFIKPNLKQNYIVICDRYVNSSIVYQGSQDVDLDWIREINKMSKQPDLTFYLKLTPEEALKRLKQSNRTNIEKFENLKYLEKILSLYETLEDMIHIDASQSQDKIAQQILDKIIQFQKS